ncbi:MAG: FAD-dependent oxidoreductase [Vicinamibacterales bacterium]|jgi:2,4-dienoyl-CoA reductase-like NADH-dependent reductase (Old Yellow Enzyme family)|nr:FAD-dependent oxidoreductase [Arenicellales bacterium]MDP7210328.1 FAD-dependent oxidoreductase [Vicinamibacterales bacterium]|tara:strand:+ start:8502 stop:10520 length:2019 start_codon:yes stop_codon:yes gene_type:complete
MWKRLFEPLQIGPVTVNNRLGFAPNCPVTDGDLSTGVFGDDSVAYYAERAKGGQGLVIIGNSRVSERTPYFPCVDPNMFDDRNIPWLKKISREVHKYDGKLFIQLFYTSWGRNTLPQQSSMYESDAPLTVPGPSSITNATLGVHLAEMTVEDIQQVSEEFAEAAVRAVKGGVDGVEISLHHLMLHAQFFSKVYNLRMDQYGGSMENRVRFAIETLHRVRRAVGNSIAIGYRINSQYENPADNSLEEMKEIVQYINANADVDYVSVSAGGGDSPDMIAPMGHLSPGYQMPNTAEIKSVTDLPVFGIGSITSPYQAEDALAKNQCDLVLMVRQLFADPEFANKAREGRPDDIRPCVRYSFCTTRFPFRVGCFQNVAHGRERKWGIGSIKEVDEPKGVFVIGGGAAGLEAARVAAERGHYVVIYEREDRIGGRLRLQAKLPGQHEWGNLTAWYEHILRNPNIVIHTGEEVTAQTLHELIEEQQPDSVVLASGSQSASDGFIEFTGGSIPGWDSEMVLPYEDVLDQKVEVGQSVTIFDNVSNELAIGLGLFLARMNRSVSIITPHSRLASDHHTNHSFGEVHLHDLLNKPDVSLHTNTHIQRIEEGKVFLVNQYTNGQSVEQKADSLILINHFEHDQSLRGALATTELEVNVIGDALGYGPMHDAILEGHRVGRSI